MKVCKNSITSLTSNTQTHNDFGFVFDKSTSVCVCVCVYICSFSSGWCEIPLALEDLTLDLGRAATSIPRAVFGSARFKLTSACRHVCPHLLLFDLSSVVSVEALRNRADVWLSIHPDLSENPLTLFKPLGPVQV